jgi:hypothetical protein
MTADRPPVSGEPRECPDCHEPIIGAAHWHEDESATKRLAVSGEPSTEPIVAWRGTPEYDAARAPSTDLRERIAAIEHEQWEHWSRTVAEQGLTPERIERWHRYWVPYADLDEPTKDFDREWADKVLAAVAGARATPPSLPAWKYADGVVTINADDWDAFLARLTSKEER